MAAAADGAGVRVSTVVKPLDPRTRQLDVVLQDGAARPAGVMRFVLRDQAQVWVLARAMSRRDALGCADVRLAWETSPPPAALSMARCDGLQALGRLKRALSAGAVLSANDLLPADAMFHRDPARVVVSVGAVQIEARGMVMADARVGQLVPVKVDGQPEVLRAVVVAPGEVHLMERAMQ